jgi:hypothetical protein
MIFTASWSHRLAFCHCYLHHRWEVAISYLLHLAVQVVAVGLAAAEREVE